MQRLLFLLPITALGACGASGALQQTTLAGHCAADDAACARKAPLQPLAIGATFHPDVSVSIAGTATPNLVLTSADTNVLAVENGMLVAKSPGAAAVLIATEDGAVIDFVHVWVAPVTHVTLARRDGDLVAGPIGLAVGEDVTLVPALWNGSQRLAGDSSPAWTVDADTTLSILHDGSSDRRRLRARAPGKAHVTVAFGNVSTAVDVEVVP
ncbi:MAG: hypothetical protein AB7T06_39695 [Kofleriaceae bacterium]